MNEWIEVGVIWCAASLILGLLVGGMMEVGRNPEPSWSDEIAGIVKAAANRERVELRALTFEPAEMGRQKIGGHAENIKGDTGAGADCNGLWFPPAPLQGEKR